MGKLRRFPKVLGPSLASGLLFLAGCASILGGPSSGPTFSPGRIGIWDPTPPPTHFSVRGDLYLKAGTPASGPITLQITGNQSWEKQDAVVVATISATSSYNLAFLAYGEPVFTLSGPGFRSVSRHLRQRHPHKILSGESETYVCNFGGPLDSDDPDGSFYALLADTDAIREERVAPLPRISSTRVSSIIGPPPRYENEIPAIAVLESGQFVLAGQVSSQIWLESRDGSVSPVAGVPVDYPGVLQDGTGTEARLFWPNGIAVDSRGNFVVADGGNNAIRRVTPAGVVTTLAGPKIRRGLAFSGHVDGKGEQARFWIPLGIAVDSFDNAFVVDSK